MQTQQAKYNPKGGPIVVAVDCTPNRNGSYTAMLWAAKENQVLARYPGNFLNTADDSYALEGPLAAHAGRLVEAMVVVTIPDGLKPSLVSLSVSQDGVVLATDSNRVKPGSAAVLSDLFVELVKRP